MRVQQRGRQHGELTAGQGEQHPPGAFQRLVEGPQFVAPLVHEAPQEGLVEVEVPAVGRAQRGLPDQVGELTYLPGAGQGGEHLRGDVEVIGPGTAGTGPLRIRRESEDRASTGG